MCLRSKNVTSGEIFMLTKSIFTSQNVLTKQSTTMVNAEIWKHALNRNKDQNLSNKNRYKTKTETR